MKNIKHLLLSALIGIATPVSLTLASTAAIAATAEDLNQSSAEALAKLYRANPTAAAIGKQASAVLVFPNIIKAGLVFGASYGEGALIKAGTTNTYYNTVSASWGFQAGAQSYGYVLFLMNDKALKQLESTQGWELGVGPTVVVANEGVAQNISSTTLTGDAYAFSFNQQGLMASLSIEGSKITRIQR